MSFPVPQVIYFTGESGVYQLAFPDWSGASQSVDFQPPSTRGTESRHDDRRWADAIVSGGIFWTSARPDLKDA